MIHPSIAELTKNGEINRYTLVVVAAKCARIITEEYGKQREYVEKLALSKDADKRNNMSSMIQKEYRDEKAVKMAINGLYTGEFKVTDVNGENITFGQRDDVKIPDGDPNAAEGDNDIA